jgi:hypothetical protein
MSALPPQLLPRLALAAELRVNGSTWNEVAARVGRSVRCCRRWPLLYPAEWHRCYLRAVRPHQLEAGYEAGVMLRKLGRHEDPRFALPALMALFREHCAALARFEKAEAKQAASEPALSPEDERCLRNVARLRQMSDEQFSATFEHLLISQGFVVTRQAEAPADA